MRTTTRKLKSGDVNNPITEFMKNLNGSMSPENLRGLFLANNFELPELDLEKNPSGYYELMNRYFSSRKNWVLDLGEGNYSIATDYKEGKKNPCDFFYSISQYLLDFTKEENQITSIKIQKTPCEELTNKQFYHMDACEEDNMRLVICVKDKTSDTKINAKLGPKTSKQIDFIEENSFGTCVFPNLSEISIPLKNKKVNGTILPRCFFIFIDFKPSQKIVHTTQSLLYEIDERNVGKIFKNFTEKISSKGKNFSMDKLTEKLGSGFPEIPSLLEKFLGKEKQKEPMKDEKGKDFILPEDTEEMKSNYLEKFKKVEGNNFFDESDKEEEETIEDF